MLRELMPKAVRIALLVNPAGEPTTLNELVATAGRLGLETIVLNAGSNDEIDAAFADIARHRAEALFVFGDGFFSSRRVQLATLAARDRLPASYSQRAYVKAGGLMSYGPDFADSFRQVGIYTGSILKGAKPSDLPANDAHRFGWISLRPSDARDGRQRRSSRGEMQKSTAGKFHGALQRSFCHTSLPVIRKCRDYNGHSDKSAFFASLAAKEKIRLSEW
jgi:hypothetical protein